jgi:hypothetical protein
VSSRNVPKSLVGCAAINSGDILSRNNTPKGESLFALSSSVYSRHCKDGPFPSSVLLMWKKPPFLSLTAPYSLSIMSAANHSQLVRSATAPSPLPTTAVPLEPSSFTTLPSTRPTRT